MIRGGFILALLVVGCAGVTPLSLDDPRLSADSRRTLASTEDAVSVTRAARDLGVTRLSEAKAWRSSFSTSVDWPPQGAEAATARAALADATVELARLQLTAAEALVELEQAKRDQVVARLSIRHEVALYDLDDLRATIDEARKRVATAGRTVHDFRESMRVLDGNWWKAYRSYVKAGGDKRVLWVPRQ